MIPAAARWFRFGLVGLGGMGVQVLLLVTLADGMGVNVLLSSVGAVGAAILHNFVWHLRWTWADRTRRESVARLFTRFTAANGLVSLVGNAVLVAALVEITQVPVAAASLIAIATCGLVNYVLADSVVFTAPE
jgi:putative flippase GtrA